MVLILTCNSASFDGFLVVCIEFPFHLVEGCRVNGDTINDDASLVEMRRKFTENERCFLKLYK